MRYRNLSPTGDRVFGHGQADFLRDTPETVRLAVVTRLRLWYGEWYLDVTAGTPYQQGALGTHKQKSIEPTIRDRIRKTPGVSSIDSFEFFFDETERKATILATITTIYGPLTINEVL